ncbi:MAG TPA: class I SAM-dependent methyltransferase, partial [Candidatus Enterocloster faecavium]|nr:class I SAM-dependent methyltransferase [Candidatus Enterocloster faecavium]
MNHKNPSPDYGNWVPIAMMKGMAAVLLALLALTIVLAWLLPFPLPAVLTGILTAVLFLLWLYMLRCRALFDFNRGGLMGKLHQYLIDHLDWDGRGRLLEVGCGSGALINRCAKR